MKKVRINTSLRNKLEFYVRSQINAGMDATPLEAARRRLEAEAIRLLAVAYPAEEMALLARYGMTDRYARLRFALPGEEGRVFTFAQPLPHDVPECRRGNCFVPMVEADAAFAAAAAEVARIEDALRSEAERQWKQAEVLVHCALYFEDVLDYLGIPDQERVSLSHRWKLPVIAARPDENLDVLAGGSEVDDEATAA